MNKEPNGCAMWLMQQTCKHVFKGIDMQLRDAEGMVNWPCSKCGKMFREPYGLAMQNYGKITGPWGGLRTNHKPHNAKLTSPTAEMDTYHE